jgi:acyl-CoA hydrolase
MQEISMEKMATLFEPQEIVYLAGSSGEPTELSSLLADADAKIADATFLTSFVPGINARCLARPGHRSRVAIFFMQPAFRAASAEGRVDFRPMSYFGIHRYLTDRATRIDTAVVQVAPPDRHGLCSMGPAVEFMPSVISRATRLFGVINSSVSRLRGSVDVPFERFQRVAYSSAPLATYEVGAASASSQQLVEHLAKLIPSGATLQVGLGKIPSQLLRALSGHRALNLHTGMISDAVLGLSASGALRRHRPICTGVALGTADFYARLGGMRGLALAEVGFTHAPQTLGKLRRLYAVNSALEVDLLGQANAEMLDGSYISGPGGLPDFARAAHLDSEGLSIIALNATGHRAATSRIVPRLAPGTPVSVPQHDVDAVVTEYGVAMLRGQSLHERAHRLCAIAHPDHRRTLQQAVREILD